MRVPALMISPFSRGGNVVSEVLDHTSQLKLVAERFGVEVPNVSAWRKATVGDLTSAVMSGTCNTSVPAIAASPLPPQTLSGSCSLVNQDTEPGGAAPSVPTNQTMPVQQGGTAPASDYIAIADSLVASDAASARIVLGPPSPGRVTLKSSYNKLADPSLT
jgi:phospholipase C